MKNAVLAALISLCLAIPAVAIDSGGPPQSRSAQGGPPPPRPGEDFGQMKAEILKRIDERLGRLQQVKACIQSAKTRENARACREKFEPRDRPENRKR